jgi:predicted dehydrogenase
VGVRIGVLGAARIAPAAVIRPARQVDDAEVAAVAARDRTRAEAFARKHHIARVVDSYDALVADPDIDAIYNPLPNGLHGRWTMAALEAGKHVLCEKPFTANADEARAVADVARRSGRVVMEAFHYRYHPLFQRLVDIVQRGELGTVRHLEAALCFPLPRFSDIRYQLELAGGALMDAGCYPIHMVRSLAAAEPEVTSATMLERSPGVDRAAEAELRFTDGRTARIVASMWSRRLLALRVRVSGDEGELRVFNPNAPQLFHRVVVRTREGRRTERFPREPTYLHQLRAFTRAVLHGEPIITGVDDAIANMTVIDAVYRAAGLEPRKPTP